jgi:hypothetical protein
MPSADEIELERLENDRRDLVRTYAELLARMEPVARRVLSATGGDPAAGSDPTETPRVDVDAIIASISAGEVAPVDFAPPSFTEGEETRLDAAHSAGVDAAKAKSRAVALAVVAAVKIGLKAGTGGLG